MRRRKPVGRAPHVRGSDTSEAAANLIRPVAESMEKKVFACIFEAGAEGCTDRELEEKTKIRHQTVSARRRTLVLKGKVRDSGLRRFSRVENSDEKVEVTVWVVGEDVNVVEGTLQKAPRRPKEASLVEAIHEIKMLVMQARATGYEPSVHLQELGAWLNYLARHE